MRRPSLQVGLVSILNPADIIKAQKQRLQESTHNSYSCNQFRFCAFGQAKWIDLDSNSVADLDSLRDPLARCNEFFITNCPARMVSVFMILKERVAERVSILQMEAAKGRGEQEARAESH